jgi:GntR family transcriptional regulator/MocR family aminotransferase
MCSSALQALDLALTVLVDAGDTVCVETPGYGKVGVAVERCGAVVAAAAIDDCGLLVDDLEERFPDARACYTTSAAQFPTGVALSLARRKALAAWAQRGRRWIIEDEYGVEFVAPSRQLPPVQSLIPLQTCLIGTFSQVLLPDLRMAYLVVPPHVVPAFRTAREHQDRFSSIAPQMALHALMADGVFGAHVRKVSTVAARRLELLIRTLAETCGDALAVSDQTGGSWVYARCRRGRSEADVLRAAERAGLIVTGAAGCWRQSDVAEPAVLLGYLHLSDTAIADACRRLAESLRA